MKVLLALVLAGVAAYYSACYPREIVHTQRSMERELPDTRFRQQVALSFGPGSMGIARWVTGRVDDESTQNVSQYLKDVRRVQFGVYETDNMPDLSELELPARLQRKLDNDEWELAATLREEGTLVWVLYREDEDGQTVESMFAVFLEDNRLILASLDGDLNELMKKVVADHRAIPDMLSAARSDGSEEPARLEENQTQTAGD